MRGRRTLEWAWGAGIALALAGAAITQVASGKAYRAALDRGTTHETALAAPLPLATDLASRSQSSGSAQDSAIGSRAAVVASTEPPRAEHATAVVSASSGETIAPFARRSTRHRAHRAGGAGSILVRQARQAGPTTLARRALADSVRAVLDAAVADSAFPGAFAVVGNRAGVLAQYGAGRLDGLGGDAARADTSAANPRPDEHTLWDLASLTKVVGTTSAIMQLVERKKVDLDAPVQRYLPSWKGANKEKVTVRHLLTHSSGLPAWRPLYKEAEDPQSALAVVYATELDTLPGIRYVYSDLGAVLLGEIVRQVSGQPLDVYLARHVFAPLGMRDTRFRPPVSLRSRIAPTEYDPWRQRKLRGEVHDENAFALGGVAGHAGLFSSGHDLARLARAYLGGGQVGGVRVWRPATIARFTAVQDSAISRRALGWETPTGSNSAGHRLSPSAFGHTGFTGTSIWIDPARDLFIVLLTNRVNPSRQNLRIGGVRTRLADAVVGAQYPDSATVASPSPSSAPRP